MEEAEGGPEVAEQQHPPGEDPRSRKRPDTANLNAETVYHGNCNVRIHELSQPKRWCLFNTYKEYRQLFEANRAQSIKERVQEMFGMTPEEAELYFNTLREKKPRKVDVRAARKKMRRERQQAKQDALTIFYTVLRKAMKYAYRHVPPLLVTPMLRIVSDHMLALLAEMHDIEVPTRTSTDNLSQLLIAVADWCALFVSNIYYELEVEDRKEQQMRAEMAALPDSDESTLTEEETAKKKDETQTKLTDYSDVPGSEAAGEVDDEETMDTTLAAEQE